MILRGYSVVPAGRISCRFLRGSLEKTFVLVCCAYSAGLQWRSVYPGYLGKPGFRPHISFTRDLYCIGRAIRGEIRLMQWIDHLKANVQRVILQGSCCICATRGCAQRKIIPVVKAGYGIMFFSMGQKYYENARKVAGVAGVSCVRCTFATLMLRWCNGPGVDWTCLSTKYGVQPDGSMILSCRLSGKRVRKREKRPYYFAGIDALVSIDQCAGAGQRLTGRVSLSRGIGIASRRKIGRVFAPCWCLPGADI